MRRQLTAVSVAIVFACGVAAWGTSLAPRSWKKHGTAAFSSASDGGLSMALPTWPSHLGYAWTSAPGPLRGTLVVQGRVETVGAPIFRWETEPSNTCQVPATVRPFVGRWSQKGQKHIAFADRWWALNPYSYVLAAGSFAIAVPIDRTFFTGWWANGALSPDAAFQLTMDSPHLIGLSFGGGCFFGHGVGVEGGLASVVVTSYRVE